jgi:hypothetical protein
MKAFAAFAGALLITVACSAQDLSPAADQDSNQSVAAAARANPAPKIDPAKEADIRKLLDVTGAGNLGIQAMAQMETTMKPMISNALPPGDYREKLVNLFFEKFHSKIEPSTLINMVVPVYDKYLSDDDIRGLIQIYQTPIGQKLITVMPQVVAESQAAGEKWGEKLGRECMMEVLAEHPELEKAMVAAQKSGTPQAVK